MGRAGLGQSTWIGVGGDPVKGTRFSELLDYFGAAPQTRSIVTIGEIGGTEEEELARAIKEKAFDKPCHCLVAGAGAPVGKTLGHDGALVHGRHGSFAAKVEALSQAGVSWRTSGHRTWIEAFNKFGAQRGRCFIRRSASSYATRSESSLSSSSSLLFSSSLLLSLLLS